MLSVKTQVADRAASPHGSPRWVWVVWGALCIHILLAIHVSIVIIGALTAPGWKPAHELGFAEPT